MLARHRQKPAARRQDSTPSAPFSPRPPQPAGPEGTFHERRRPSAGPGRHEGGRRPAAADELGRNAGHRPAGPAAPVVGSTSAGSLLSLAVIAVVATVLTGSLLPRGLTSVARCSGRIPTTPRWPPAHRPGRPAAAGPHRDRRTALRPGRAPARDGDRRAAGRAPVANDGSQGLPKRYHQSQFEERNDGVEVWEYLASVAVVSASGGVGQVTATVHTASNRLPTQVCPLALTFWGTQAHARC